MEVDNVKYVSFCLLYGSINSRSLKQYPYPNQKVLAERWYYLKSCRAYIDEQTYDLS